MRYSILIVIFFLLVSCQSNNRKKIINEPSLPKFSSIQKDFYSQAQRSFAAGNYKKSLSLYEQLNKYHDSNKIINFEYAETLRLSGNFEDSIKIYNKLIKGRKYKYEAMEGKALAFLQMGDTKAAENLLLKIIEQDGSRWQAVNALGVIYSLDDKLTNAKIYYEMALSIDESNSVILNNIGLAMALSGSKDEGLKVLERAKNNLLSTDMRRKRTIDLNIALIYGLKGEFKIAESILKEHMSDASIFNNLAMYASLRDDYKLAKSYLSKALWEHPVHYDKAWKNKQFIEGNM